MVVVLPIKGGNHACPQLCVDAHSTIVSATNAIRDLENGGDPERAKALLERIIGIQEEIMSKVLRSRSGELRLMDKAYFEANGSPIFQAEEALAEWEMERVRKMAPGSNMVISNDGQTSTGLTRTDDHDADASNENAVENSAVLALQNSEETSEDAKRRKEEEEKANAEEAERAKKERAAEEAARKAAARKAAERRKYDLLSRLQSAIVNPPLAGSGTDLMYVLGKCDPNPYMTAMNSFLQLLRNCRGDIREGETKMTLRLLEAVLVGFMKLVNSCHMPVVERAKARAIAQAEKNVKKRYRGGDLSRPKAAVLMTYDDDSDRDRSSFESDPVVVAARTAAQALEGNKAMWAWVEYAKGSPSLWNFYKWANCNITAIQVMYQITFDDYLAVVPGIKQTHIKALQSLLEEKYGSSLGELSLAAVLEEAILPSSHPDEDSDVRLAGFGLAMSIAQIVGGFDKGEGWTSQFLRAESVPSDRTYDSYDDHENEITLVQDQQDRFFSLTEWDGKRQKNTRTGSGRKKQCINMLFYPIFSSFIASTLSKHNLTEEFMHDLWRSLTEKEVIELSNKFCGLSEKTVSEFGLSDEQVENFTFALCCSRASNFDDKVLKFCTNQKLIDGTVGDALKSGNAKEVMELLAGLFIRRKGTKENAKGDVTSMFSAMDAALESFECKAYLYVDAKDATETYDTVASYLGRGNYQG